MKLLVFTFVVCFTAVLAAPADKPKREILPGDPRYGTEHHLHHHEHENEVQISKAAGGYVGSFTVPDDTADHSFQVQPQSTYGPPNHTPGKPLGTDFFASSDADKTPATVLVPSTSYGIPDTTQLLNTDYLGPVIDDKQSAIIKSPVLDLNTDYQVPSLQAPGTSYDIIKTTVQEQPKTVNVKSEQPAVVHKHIDNIPQTVSLPQAKVTRTQGVHSIPSFTSSINSFPSYLSYPSYSSYGNIPVKTIDRHVSVQVPHPYHVPVTKHVAVPYPFPQAVEVPKPYYVRVPQPVQVTVDRPYPVEVPRPVPYPVPHYVKTNVAHPVPVAHAVPVAHPVSVAHPLPVAHQHHVVVDSSKASPLQTFVDNTQSTFQNVLAAVPSFPNSLNFQNPFENIDLSSFPPLSFIPQQIQTPAPVTPDVNVFSSINTDSVTVDNPALKTETTFTKPIVVPVKPTYTQPGPNKPSTACAGCTVTSAASNKQEYVQPTDANGGYVY